MADAANVDSIEALQDFRAAWVRFLEDAKNALTDVDFELTRATEWLNHDRRLYWAAEVRRRNQDLADAKSELHRKKLGRMHGHHPDTSAEDKALRIAKVRFEESEEKVETVRSWIPELQHEAQEYRSHANPLGDMIEGELKHALAKLDHMLDALDAYLHLQAPTVPRPTAAAGSFAAANPVAAPAPVQQPAGSPTPELEVSQDERTVGSE
jgi:hypothetical protein